MPPVSYEFEQDKGGKRHDSKGCGGKCAYSFDIAFSYQVPPAMQEDIDQGVGC